MTPTPAKYGIWVHQMVFSDRDIDSWLASFDLEYHPPGQEDSWVRGLATFTDDPNSALAFDSKEEALAFYLRQSQTVPLRPDGKPNQPLCAYTIEVLALDETPILMQLAEDVVEELQRENPPPSP